MSSLEPLNLRAGPLAMVFERQGAFLRYLRLDGREILRGVYAAVRDENWGTVAPAVSKLKLETTMSAFRLTFEAAHQEREIDFRWQGEITGSAEGTVRFVMDGLAESTFRRNRIGFCVLHPATYAGQACTVERMDGTVQEGHFPRLISPHQPFFDMRAILHEAAPGLAVRVSFEGDTFEMEDQRNWTDDSFKTYCTPLALPFPVEIKAGTRIKQAVTLELEGALPEDELRSEGPSAIHIGVAEAPTERLPRLGLGVASHAQALTEREVARLKALNLSHLRVDLKVSGPFEEDLRRAAAEAGALGVALEVALFVTDAAESELQRLEEVLNAVRPSVARWLVFHTSQPSARRPWVELARRHLAPYGGAIVSGTNTYFTELNRERPPVEVLDGVCYSLNPQVHAFDDASLVETLAAQAYTVSSAREFFGVPVAVTPVTLKPRFNPNATGPEPEPAPGELPTQVDPRQASLFGAGWTLGSLKYLAESGVRSVTYYETTGWRGVMEREAGSPLPQRFPSLPGGVFPLYHLLADVGEYAGGQVLPSRSSDRLAVESFALRHGDKTRILIANLSPAFQPVRLAYPALARHVRVKRLTAEDADVAMRDPEAYRAEPGLSQGTTGGVLELSLAPFATVRIDTVIDAVKEEDSD